MFKLNLAKRKIYLGIRTLLFLLAFIIVPVALAENYLLTGSGGVATKATGAKSIANSTGLVTIFDNSCKKIINTSTISYFIPTATSSEWAAFLAHPPLGITIDTCAVCTAGACCDIPTGQFKAAGTSCRASTGICDPAETCTGAATGVMISDCPSNILCATNQYWNGTSCVAGNCATSGSCISPAANGSDGSCNPYWTTQVCNGLGATCTGTTTNNYCYGTSGQVWWSNTYQTGSATVRCNTTITANSCSGQQPQGDAMYCNAAGSCSVTGVKVNVGAACGGGENSMCVNGTCVNKCSNLNGGSYVGDSAPNGDADGYADAQDSDCGGGSQCTSGDCCDIPNGRFLAANTVIGTCGYCTGASNVSADQGSSRDIGNQCATGAAGSATSCQTLNCAASGRSCGYITAVSNTICRAASGVCDADEICTGVSFGCPTDTVKTIGSNTVCDACAATGAVGACSVTDTGYKCDGALKTCGTGNSYTCPTNFALGNIWNGTASTTATCALSTSAGAIYSCSGATIQKSAYGCNTSGGADLTTIKATCASGTTYPGGAWTSTTCTKSVGGEGSSVCVNGQGTCQNLCSDGSDNDLDTFKDGQDTDCGGYGQCLAGDCCNIATGQIMAINTVIGTCGKCTGALTDIPTKTSSSVNQTSAEDLGNQCDTGVNGSATSCKTNTCSGSSRACGFITAASNTTCRSTAGVCDQLEKCDGTAFTCPTDIFLSGNTCNAVNGVCDAPELCTGLNALCPTDTVKTIGSNTVCDTCTATGAVGDCSITDTGYKCDGALKTCGTANPYTCPANTSLGNIYNGSIFTAATCALSKSAGATYSCSGTTIQRSAYGCNTSGGADSTTIKATCASGTTYPGGAWTSTNCTKSVGGEGTSVCVNGQGTCQDLCADGNDNDGDGNIDALDPDCGAQCLAGDCCNLATHMWRPAGYCPGTCNVCSGSSDTSTTQTSGQDSCNQCATGADGSATSCQSNNCSGTGLSCGIITAVSNTTCRTSKGSCDNVEKCAGAGFTCPSDVVCAASQYWNGTSCVAGNCATFGSCASPLGGATDGSCSPYYNTQICSGSAATCTGATNNNFCYGASGQVWWSNVYQAGSATIKCNATITATSCNGQQPQGNAMYCNAALSCSVTGVNVAVGAACGGGENSMCVNGTCVNKCSNTNGGSYVGDTPPNGDGDGYADAQDSDCGGGSQCTSGDCCDIPNGRLLGANTLIGTCGYCDGVSNTSQDQGSSRDIGNQCDTGAAGSATSCKSANCAATGRTCGYLTSASTCRASAGACDKADTCSGSAYTCADNYCLAGQYWNGAACVTGYCSTGTFNSPASGSCSRTATDTTCSGLSGTLCNGASSDRYEYASSAGKVWNGSIWTDATCALNKSVGTPYSCSGTTIQNSAYGCNTSGGIDTTTPKANCASGTTCTIAVGGEGSSVCVTGQNSCKNLCGDDIDNDIDNYKDLQDSGCLGAQQCLSGTCCNTATAAYKLASVVCSPGTFDTPSPGSCSRTATSQYCPGNGANCTGLTSNTYDYASVGNIWNGSSWTSATCALSTSAGATYSCSGATIQRSAYGCNTSGGGDTSTAQASCSSGTTYPGGAWTSTTCTKSSGSEGASVCVSGQSACQNLCGDGIDNDGDGYKDGQDTDCGGGGQCALGACCNTSTGYLLPSSTMCRTWAGSCDNAESCTGALTDVATKASVCPTDTFGDTWSICSYGSCASPSTGSGCTYTYANKHCSGYEVTCTNGASVNVSPYPCTCSYGTVWNGSSCATPSDGTLNCGTGSSYFCHDWYGDPWNYQSKVNTLSCNGSGTCNVDTGYSVVNETCSSVCIESTGLCGTCNVASDCGVSALTNGSCTWPTAQAQYLSYYCTNGACSNSLGSVIYHTCSGIEGCNSLYYAQQTIDPMCQALTCSNGYYISEGECTTCPPGQWTIWSPGSRFTSCTPCPPGMYANDWGMQCTECPENYFCIGGAYLETCASIASVADPRYYSPPGSSGSNQCQETPYSG